MNKECDVIITYCWNRVGYNILRSLASHGLKVWVSDISAKNICSLSRFCTGSFVYPDYTKDERAFIACLKQKVIELKPKMLLPTHDESVVIMRYRKEFPKELIIPYETEKLLLMLADKASSTKIAERIGIPVPKVYYSVKEVKEYPVVFKTVIGNSAKGVYFPKNEDELEILIQKYKDEPTLLEQWIGGTDYSVDCVRWDGFWKSAVYHAIITKTKGGGTTTQREIVNVPELERFAKLLLDAVDFHGVCGLDFRYDSVTGQTAYIETNVRFTGGLATPICAGFDIPWIVYKLATEGNYGEEINVKIGTKTKWILGDMITLIGRILSCKWSIKEMKQIFKFSGFDAFDDYFEDDKKAICGELYYYFVKLVKNRKLNP
ncbi:ATP-grasp domain-containing protein [Butyricimonas paravirosa]|uniref:ATP-grasp domain-containing protein n=1 Tax=Butyricimonas paravirosa TaxID=1472417 RepID=UPI0022E3D05B|nr:ATP-grasp domain-containing protein [Butyricimonas paravirosa]